MLRRNEVLESDLAVLLLYVCATMGGGIGAMESLDNGRKKAQL